MNDPSQRRWSKCQSRLPQLWEIKQAPGLLYKTDAALWGMQGPTPGKQLEDPTKGALSISLCWDSWLGARRLGRTPVECASRPQPKSGVYGIFSQRARLATLTIKTPPDANYMVKLDDANTREPVMSLYVPAGTTQDVEVPIGQYVLKSASGERWCGDNELFGTSTSTSIAIETFSFASADVHWTVELIRQKSGNLRQRAIPRSEF